MIRLKKGENERVTYIFSSKRAKTVLAHINNGAYEKDRELKHLWDRAYEILKEEISKKSIGKVARELGLSKATISLIARKLSRK